MIQVQNLSLSDRLKVESSRRIQGGVYSQIVLLALLGAMYGSEPDQTLLFVFLVGVAIFLVVARGIIFKWHSKHPERILRLYHYVMIITLMTAFTYGCMVYDSISHYKVLNPQVMVMIFVVTAMMTAVLSSLAAATFYQRLYFLLIAGPMIFACLNPDVAEIFRNVGIIYVIYVVYLVYNSFGVTKDLLRAYKAEISAREQKDTLQSVIDLVPGFVALSDAQGNWITTSHTFKKHEDSPAFQEIFKQFRLGKSIESTREISWYEDGEIQSFVLSTRKYPDLSMIIVGVPAEEIFEMRRELDSQRLKAEFSSRLATLGEMAGGIAHEVNNPLAVIIGICSQVGQMTKQPQPDLEKISDKIEKISKTSFRISKIISGLQSFSRQTDQDPFLETKLAHIIEDTLELCREKFYQNAIQLQVGQVPDFTLPVRAVQISQVLINLLNNAFDAVKPLADRRVNIDFHWTNKDLFIVVSDSGPGIAPIISKRMFDPFFTTKEIGQGTGLGLSISRSILLDHEGEIQLLSDESKTTFRIRLPLKRKVTPIS